MALAQRVDISETSLKCIKAGGKVYELAVKGAITISRSINTASSLQATILRDEITVEKGDTLDFTLDKEHHQFFGIVMETDKQDEWCTVTAYDQLWYFNKNKRNISYENITLHELLGRLCTDRGYAMSDPPQFEDTVHPLPARVENNTTELAILTNAIEALYPVSKVKYFLWDDAGYIRLNSTNWLAGEPQIIISNDCFESYSYREDAQEGYSVVRLEEQITSSEGSAENKTYLGIDPATNDKYGTIEYYDTVAEGENGQEKANSLVQEKSQDFEKIELTINGCQGDITVRGGTPLLVDMFTEQKKEYIRGWFETQAVTHTIENGYHTMDLTLKLMKSLDEWDNTDPNYYSHWVIN